MSEKNRNVQKEKCRGRAVELTGNLNKAIWVDSGVFCLPCTFDGRPDAQNGTAEQ
jgi:hypothetical protein